MLTDKYTPKAGDKVRATLGENMLVGVVTVAHLQETQDYFEVDVAGFDVISVDDSWQFEQVVSLPSKFGAVIRRADGAALVLGGATETLKWYGPRGWVNDREATFGGFTVLFDGVDE